MVLNDAAKNKLPFFLEPSQSGKIQPKIKCMHDRKFETKGLRSDVTKVVLGRATGRDKSMVDYLSDPLTD